MGFPSANEDSHLLLVLGQCSAGQGKSVMQNQGCQTGGAPKTGSWGRAVLRASSSQQPAAAALHSALM